MHTLQQGDWEYVPFSDYPEDVSTGGMGPCAGVLIYDHDTKDTYGAHYPWPHTTELPELRAFLDTALSKFDHSSKVSVFIGGCCDDGSLEGAKQTREARPVVEDEVRKRFEQFASIRVMWPATGIKITELILDPETGDCHVVNDDSI
jgi:hypothetical protein